MKASELKNKIYEILPKEKGWKFKVRRKERLKSYNLFILRGPDKFLSEDVFLRMSTPVNSWVNKMNIINSDVHKFLKFINEIETNNKGVYISIK